MDIELHIGSGFIDFILGLKLSGDDKATVIGDSRIAYLAKSDNGLAFMSACIFHDQCYTVGDSAQDPITGMRRWQVDQEFLKKMLNIAEADLDLEKEALELYYAVRKWGADLWEGPPDPITVSGVSQENSYDKMAYHFYHAGAFAESKRKLITRT